MKNSPLVRVLLAFGLLALALLAFAWFARPDGRLHVFVLDAPGDAVLIQTPRGGYVLIDGGADPALLASHLGRRLPFWRRDLDVAALTQADANRLPGQIAALSRYRAGLALAPPLHDNSNTREWLRLVQEQDTPVRRVHPGEQINLGGAVLTILATGDGAESGVAMQLDYGATSMVLCGACGDDLDDALLETARPITALVYPWQRELDTPLLAAWRPRAIIFTTAYEAAYPALLTMHERRLNGASVYHPELDGTIELISDGRRVWITTERQENSG